MAKLNNGELYYGEVKVFGKTYDAGYEPIKDAWGARSVLHRLPEMMLIGSGGVTSKQAPRGPLRRKLKLSCV